MGPAEYQAASSLSRFVVLPSHRICQQREAENLAQQGEQLIGSEGGNERSPPWPRRLSRFLTQIEGAGDADEPLSQPGRSSVSPAPDRVFCRRNEQLHRDTRHAPERTEARCALRAQDCAATLRTATGASASPEISSRMSRARDSQRLSSAAVQTTELNLSAQSCWCARGIFGAAHHPAAARGRHAPAAPPSARQARAPRDPAVDAPPRQSSLMRYRRSSQPALRRCPLRRAGRRDLAQLRLATLPAARRGSLALPTSHPARSGTACVGLAHHMPLIGMPREREPPTRLAASARCGGVGDVRQRRAEQLARVRGPAASAFYARPACMDCFSPPAPIHMHACLRTPSIGAGAQHGQGLRAHRSGATRWLRAGVWRLRTATPAAFPSGSAASMVARKPCRTLCGLLLRV
jgi:hypothetical protein